MTATISPDRGTIAKCWREPPKPDPARVRVYDAEKVRQLLEPEQQHHHHHHAGGVAGRTTATKSSGGIEAALRAQAKSEKRRKAKEAEDERLRRYERQREEVRRRQAAAERLVREKIAENQIKQERRYNELRGDIAEGHKLADEIHRHLSLHEMNVRSKLKRRFDEWNRTVYGAIQDQINDQLESIGSDELNRRRRNEFQKFLDTTNAKGAIFRDIIIESEYDPLEPNRNCIKFRTDGIKDPLRRVLDKHIEETVTDHHRSKKKPVVREMLAVSSWATGKIEATPHGYFSRLTEDGKERNARESKTYTSHIPFDHYHVPTGKQVTDREFPVGKRAFNIPGTLQSLGD